MKNVMVLGAGKIGKFIALMLSAKYKVTLVDLEHTDEKLAEVNTLVLDVNNKPELLSVMHDLNIDVVISCLPHFLTKTIAAHIIESGRHYFDLTEDVAAAASIAKLAQTAKGLVVPQCGLAPGFVSIIAQHIISDFEQVDTVRMRVGALPIHVSNALQYALTWSTDGLINEYIQDTAVLRNSRKVMMPGLSGLETIKIDGLTYEAFNTSGGAGSLIDTYTGKIKNMDYKTIRYPGHCEKMHFLLKQLHLEDHPDWMKQILEHVIPQTSQDLVLIHVSVIGEKSGVFMEHSYTKKFYSTEMFGKHWSAIQLCTASSVCAVMDFLLTRSAQESGMVKQESIPFAQFVANDYGKVFMEV